LQKPQSPRRTTRRQFPTPRRRTPHRRNGRSRRIRPIHMNRRHSCSRAR
jgi:hypothetical protein